MTVSLLFAILLQAGGDDSPDQLVRRILEAERSDPAILTAHGRLEKSGVAGQKAVREALTKRYQTRPIPTAPVDLVRRLDGSAVLELQDLGYDAIDALEEADRTAEGDRRALIRQLLQRARENPRREAPPLQQPPLNLLLRVLTNPQVSGDEFLLVQVLIHEPSNAVRDQVRTVLPYYVFSGETLKALLAAADLRPWSLGRALWKKFLSSTPKDEPDWKELLEKGGSWTRAVAAFRLKDPAVLEQVSERASSIVRRGIIESLPFFAIAEDQKPAFILRLMTKLADDDDRQLRSAALSTIETSHLDAPDLLLLLLLRETDSSMQDRLVEQAGRCKSPPSVAALRKVLDADRISVIPKLSPLFVPDLHPGLAQALFSAYDRTSAPRDRRQIALILARYGHETGIRQIEADLKSSDVDAVQSALDEITRYRLSRYVPVVWSLHTGSNSDLAARARPVAVLLGAAEHPEEVKEILGRDDRVRDRVSNILLESGGPADVPLAAVLARTQNYLATNAALKVLGKFEYPRRLAEILGDLTAADAAKRHEAEQKYDHTDRSGIRYRVVEGPGAVKDKVVDVPVEVFRSLAADWPQVANEVFANLVPGPVPASLADPAAPVRGMSGSIVPLLLRRGDPEDVRRIYARGVTLAEAGPLFQNASLARDVDAPAVDAFLQAWLRNPPPGARRDVVSSGLNAAATALPAAQVRELLVSMFGDERQDVHQAPVDLVRKRPEFAFPAEAAAAFRAGKVQEKQRLFVILGAQRSPEGEGLLREWLTDPGKPVRAQSAAALGKLLKAEALPILGSAFFDWVAQARWGVLSDLAQGLGPSHREAIQALGTQAAEEDKPILEVLRYLSGDDSQRDRFLSLFPEKAWDRRAFILALSDRPGPVDESLVETLLRVDKENPVFAPYLKLLVKSDTLKAAEMAKSILESAYRLHQIEPEYGDACELIARRLPQPPLELFAYCAQSEASGMGAVRALAAVGTEPAVALLIRMRLGSYSSRTLIARSLRSAKRYPALQQQLRDLLAGSRIQGNYGNFPSFPALAYLEGDSGSLESLLKAWTHPDFDAARKLAVLQTALTIPDSDGKIQAALPTVARDSDGSESMLAEVYRVIVAGGAPKPVPSLQRSGYPLLMAAWARDRAAVAKLLESGSPTTYSQVRDLVEAAFNRPLPRFEDARHWAKNAGATATPDSMIVELQALGVTDLRRALRDDRQFVRVNAAWILQKQAGRRQYSRGPWADTTKDSSDGFRWTFPEPPAAEIEALEKP